MKDRDIKALVKELVAEHLKEIGSQNTEEQKSESSLEKAGFGPSWYPQDDTERDTTETLPEFAWMEPNTAVFDWRAGP